MKTMIYHPLVFKVPSRWRRRLLIVCGLISILVGAGLVYKSVVSGDFEDYWIGVLVIVIGIFLIVWAFVIRYPWIYEVEHLPANVRDARLLYYRLFPPQGLRMAPAKLRPEIILLDTRFEYLEYFQDFSSLLEREGHLCIVLADVPSQLDLPALSIADSFGSVILFDIDQLTADYDNLAEATKRALKILPSKELHEFQRWPKLKTFGYTETSVDDATRPEVLLALQKWLNHFYLCDWMAQEAEKEKQSQRYIACPIELEKEMARVYPGKPIRDKKAVERGVIKVITVFCLEKERMLAAAPEALTIPPEPEEADEVEPGVGEE
jgi:hypothetical protein